MADVSRAPLPWVTAGLALAALLVSLTGAASSLDLERGGGLPGALTAHLTHWSVDHLLWDLGVFVLAGALCESWHRRRYIGTLAASSIAVSAAVLARGPLPYRGLSGIDTALVALLAVSLAREELARGNRAGLLAGAGLLAAICGKALYESLAGSTLFVDSRASAMIPVPLAHLVGAAAGALAGLTGPALHERRPLYSPQPCAPRDRRATASTP